MGAPRAVTAPEPTPPAAAPGAGSRLALLADDDSAVRALLARLLARTGFAVAEAVDGPAALRAARALAAAGHRPALLVSDVETPGLDGVEVAVAVAGPSGPAAGAAVLLVSGCALPPGAAAALAGVRHAFLSKPFTPAGVEAALAQLTR